MKKCACSHQCMKYGQGVAFDQKLFTIIASISPLCVFFTFSPRCMSISTPLADAVIRECWLFEAD